MSLNKPDVLETAALIQDLAVETTVNQIVNSKVSRPLATGYCLSPLCGDELEKETDPEKPARLFCNSDCGRDYEKYKGK